MAKDEKDMTDKSKGCWRCCGRRKWYYAAAALLALFIVFKLGKYCAYYDGYHGRGHMGMMKGDMMKGGMMKGGMKMQNLLQVADENGDYIISREEFNALFDKLDSDENGTINNEFMQLKDLMRDQK